MFMRFIQFNIRPELITQFKEFYKEVILAKLQLAEGCLFAGLLGSENKENFISVTFWKTLSHAENYEKIGEFQDLLNKAQPYFLSSNEWKLNITPNFELQYTSIEEKPEIQKFSIKTKENDFSQFNSLNKNTFVRLVSEKIQPGKLKEFEQIYSQQIIPELKKVRGCRHAFLIESVTEKNLFLSVTIWDSKDDAENYEASGKFHELVKIVEHTFSQLYLWKISLEENYGAKVGTSEDLKVDYYKLLTGKSFI